MNKSRKKRLEKALGEVERLKNLSDVMAADAQKLADGISAVGSEIETLQDEEQMAHDNLPEYIQWSERGETMQGIADALEEAKYSLDEAVDSINGALNAA